MLYPFPKNKKSAQNKKRRDVPSHFPELKAPQNYLWDFLFSDLKSRSKRIYLLNGTSHFPELKAPS